MTVLRYALPQEAAIVHAALLDEFGSVGAVLSPEAHHPVDARISAAALAFVRSLGAMHRAALLERVEMGPVLSRAQDLHDYLSARHAHLKFERLSVLYLNARQELLADETFGIGTLHQVAAPIAQIILKGIQLGASALILVHNHPSGDPTPSKIDIEVTKQIVQAAEMFGMGVHDHIIIARDRAASFRALGLL